MLDVSVRTMVLGRRQSLASTSNEDEVEEENNDGDEDTEENGKTSEGDSGTDALKLGRHYMVFMAQTVTSVGQPYSFMVGRYCLDPLTGRWVRVNKRQITSAMAFLRIYY